MAGHSKWANIKHRKGAQDKKKAKIFNRIIKELTIASRDGGPDPDTNPALRLAIQNAKGANMPKDTMERAIKKGSGGEGEALENVSYEGYGPHGIAIFVEATTDNINRTVSNVRAAFTKYNGSLGTNGSLNFLFDRKGVFTIPKKEEVDEEEFMMELIDAGAEDVETQGDFFMVYTTFEDFGPMNNQLEEKGIEVENAELQRIPKTTTKLDIDSALQVWKLIEALEDDDDVQSVYHNMELTDELMEAVEQD